MNIKGLNITLLLLLLCFLGVGQTNENMLKAGFLEKFARFSEWPNQSMGDSFDIFIIGNCSFSDELESIYKDIKIKNLPVKINYIESVFEINSAEILFISSSHKRHIESILSQIKNKPILTIGDSKGFAKDGVTINFYTTIQNTMHFEINTNALERTGIKMDIMLLDFAKIID